LNIENRVIDILIAWLGPHYDEVSLEGGLIEIDLGTATRQGNEQPPDTRIAAAIVVYHSFMNVEIMQLSDLRNPLSNLI
jgi:hypothetical protein